ncbi:SDR family oxidoreductase [Plantactinospora mayteni]|uniref:Short-chain dehydrogenase n=1 Tax=Plantactinospora mayteni TaxID=566021 RepID=A0ABQ4EM50_9ACTN|nr:SDR family NAD(P)-dependent oxidoreductase [Plantactinospora mayteni]GIG95297.1 short-chain dehydrogenase [Plantactinospora mayteni]
MAARVIDVDMTGRTVVLTGASSGIGAAAALRLAGLGATVVPVGRSARRTAEVAARLGVEPIVADFGRLAEVRRLAETLLARCPRIDILANNAGALVSTRQVTGDGHELTFQANHLAPFLLTNLLLPRLRESARQAPVRIVTTSSLGNRFGRLRLDDLEWERRRYGGGWIAYSTTKLMNVLFTRELARRTAAVDIDAVSFHPDPGRAGKRAGGTRPEATPTNFASGSRLAPLVARTPLRRIQLTGEQGAMPLVWLAAAPEVAGSSGAYYDGFHRDARVNPQADDPRLATQLWERSAELLRAYL